MFPFAQTLPQLPQCCELESRFVSQPSEVLLLQLPKFWSQVITHELLLQDGLELSRSGQTVPQLPQFCRESRFASQPSEVLLLQSSKFWSQVITHELLLQDGLELSRSGQTVPQLPQFCRKSRFVSQPSEVLLLQSPKFWSQVITHKLLLQDGLE